MSASNMARPDELVGPCPVCGGTFLRRGPEWALRCGGCRFWRSTLGAADGRLNRTEVLDEARRADGLRPLRDANFAREIALLSRLRSLAGARVLDVGSAHGWFLEAAARCGALAEGIEPDEQIAGPARARGLQVSTGYFPEAVPRGTRFDVISFHDVLEHIVDVGGALEACRKLLHPGGLLVVAAPDAGGALFFLARVLSGVGFGGPLERLWQLGYPSPHVTYFDRTTLGRLAARHGFRMRLSAALPSLALRGLWARVHMDRTPGAGSVSLFIALAVASFVLRFLPSDQRLHVFERPAEA
ncbi:MAG TPA: class I SAM-dependent methyltransferase [Thermoanaerobaculia bacterium]|nr:class I SAM-dependent methyltransferase [Thermoanaerobaculia bacterium]